MSGFFICVWLWRFVECRLCDLVVIEEGIFCVELG